VKEDNRTRKISTPTPSNKQTNPLAKPKPLFFFFFIFFVFVFFRRKHSNPRKAVCVFVPETHTDRERVDELWRERGIDRSQSQFQTRGIGQEECCSGALYLN